MGQLDFEKLHEQRDKVLKILGNKDNYQVIERCKHVLLTHGDDKAAKDNKDLIPMFWSNFWIEQPGSQKWWIRQLNKICHGEQHVSAKANWRAAAQHVHADTIVAKMAGIQKKGLDKVTNYVKDGVDRAREMGKLDLFYLALQIGGVALQVNVKMDDNPKLASLRDSFWEDGPDGLEPSPRLKDDPDYGAYKKELTEIQNKVGTIMSIAYANTVLNDYARRPSGENAVVFAMKANPRMGFEPRATSRDIEDALESKFFFTAELPEIMQHAREFPLTLYIVVSFVNKEEQEQYERIAREAIEAAYYTVLEGQEGRNAIRRNITFGTESGTILTGHGALACCVRRDWKQTYPVLTELTDPADCRAYISEEEEEERQEDYKESKGESKSESKGKRDGESKGERKGVSDVRRLADSKGPGVSALGNFEGKGGYRKSSRQRSRRTGPLKAEAKGRLGGRSYVKKNKRKTKKRGRSARRRRSRSRRSRRRVKN